MAVEKFISTRKLVEYLDQQISERLAECHINDIGNCWLDENTPDPQLLGHAMWQVEPPLQYEDDFGESPVRHRPTDEEEVLAVSGSDFVGLMRLARTSLGLSLWQQQIAEDALLDDNHYFWLHYLSAMVMLNAASDRLREFFVMAVFRDKIKAYERRSRECRWYQTPFTQALDVGDRSMRELLGKIVPLAEKTFGHREERNAIIHEVATRIGERERHSTRERRQRFDEQQASGFAKQTLQFEDTQSRFTEAQALHAAELRKATDQIASWYKALIQMSSYVFEAENRIRRQRAFAAEAPQASRR